MKEMTGEIQLRLKVARRAVREAGRLTLDYFRRGDVTVERKGDGSPVTVADREAEALLRQHITACFPDDAILGEELGQVEGSSGYRWVLDPIDGTKSFVSGVPLYTTLLAVLHQQTSVIGIIFVPALDELVYASSGQGAWYISPEGSVRRAEVSSVHRLADSLFLTSEVASYNGRKSGHGLKTFLQLQTAARLSRTWGDAYGYLLVATGRAEVMVDPVLNLWDAAAMGPILAEAGGTFTDWHGRSTIHTGEGIGTNGKVLNEVLQLTRGH